MSTVFLHAVVSVDGFIADPDDEVGPLFDWYFNGDVEIGGGGGMKVSDASARYVKELAGDRHVAVTAGDVGGQALALGLVDEVAMDIAPVVFGAGKRYFGSLEAQHLLEDPHTVIQGDRVLHLVYRVRPQPK